MSQPFPGRKVINTGDYINNGAQATNGAPGLFLNGMPSFPGTQGPDKSLPLSLEELASFAEPNTNARDMGPPRAAMMPPQSNLMPIDPPKAPKGSGSGAIPIVDRSDYEELISRLNEKGVKSLKDQGEGLNHLRDQIGLALANRNAGLDLSALASLTDAWTGSHLAHDYARPDYDKQNQTIYGLEQALQRGRNDLSENELGLLKSQLGFEGERMAAKERAAAQAESRRQHDEEMKTRRAELADKNVESDIQRLGGVLGDSAPLVGKLQQVDTILNKYSAGSDIPGVGETDAWKPDFFTSKDGTDLRQVVQGIQSDVIRMYSGTAASEGEVRRIANSLGSKLTQGDEQFRYGMQELNEAIHRAQAEKEARFRPEVVSKYRSRGGVNSEALSGLTYGAAQKAPAAAQEIDPNNMSRDQMLRELGGK